MNYETGDVCHQICRVVLPDPGTFLSHLSAFDRFMVCWAAVFSGVVGVSGYTGKTMEFRCVRHLYIGGRLLRIAIHVVLLHYEL